MCEHSSHTTTIIVFYLNQLHVSTFVTSAIIRFEYNYQRNYVIQCDIIYSVSIGGTRSPLQRFLDMCGDGEIIYAPVWIPLLSMAA
jgi:hypothetical protein